MMTMVEELTEERELREEGGLPGRGWKCLRRGSCWVEV